MKPERENIGRYLEKGSMIKLLGDDIFFITKRRKNLSAQEIQDIITGIVVGIKRGQNTK